MSYPSGNPKWIVEYRSRTPKDTLNFLSGLWRLKAGDSIGEFLVRKDSRMEL